MVRTVEDELDDEGLGQRAMSCASPGDDDTSVPYPISFRAGSVRPIRAIITVVTTG